MMSTMDGNVIAAGFDNHPPILDKSRYNSWQSHMLLYIKGKEHGKQRYDSIINRPFKYGTVEVPQNQRHLKKHSHCQVKCSHWQYKFSLPVKVVATARRLEMPLPEFRIQQYLQHEHYALWEVIEFGDSYKVSTNSDPDDTSRRKDDEQSGETVTITTKDMQRKKTIRNEDGNIACVSTASTTFPTGSVNVATISQDTASA
nr:hypothetical protein [Tanacetum cinerariifolium]